MEMLQAEIQWGLNFIETLNNPSPANTSHSYPSPAPLLILPQVFLQLHSPQGERSDPVKDKLTTKNKGKSQHGLSPISTWPHMSKATREEEVEG